MVDAVIADLELQIETAQSDQGHYVSFRFIDVFPTLPKLKDMISQVVERDDVSLVDYNYNVQAITEKTDISLFEITKH